MISLLREVWAFPGNLLAWISMGITKDRPILTNKGVRYIISPGHFKVFFSKWVTANTLGRHVFIRETDDLQDTKLITHELVHVRQWYKFGILFPVLYALGSLVGFFNGDYYEKNPFEMAAFEAEEETE